jgi:hypothetical protein
MLNKLVRVVTPNQCYYFAKWCVDINVRFSSMETNLPSSALISVLGFYTTKLSQLISLQRNLGMESNLKDQNTLYKHMNFRLAAVPYRIM